MWKLVQQLDRGDIFGRILVVNIYIRTNTKFSAPGLL